MNALTQAILVMTLVTAFIAFIAALLVVAVVNQAIRDAKIDIISRLSYETVKSRLDLRDDIRRELAPEKEKRGGMYGYNEPLPTGDINDKDVVRTC